MIAPSTVADHVPGWTIEPAIPADARTVIVFGGAFDPPHTGHIDLPALAREKVGADWVVYVPAARPPLKEGLPVAPPGDRLAMLRLALRGVDRTSVSDVEIVRGGTSYTLDTLEQIRARLGGRVTLRLLIGADQAAQFHRWRSPGKIIELAEPIVLLRTPTARASELIETLAERWPADELARWGRGIIEGPTRRANSTRVRELLAEQGPASQEVRRYVPQGVLGYIADNKLYRC